MPEVLPTREAPRLLLERLYILDLDYQDIAGLRSLDLKRPAQVMDLGEIHVLHIVRTIIVTNLPASPVDALDLDDLSVFDGAIERD